MDDGMTRSAPLARDGRRHVFVISALRYGQAVAIVFALAVVLVLAFAWVNRGKFRAR